MGNIINKLKFELSLFDINSFEEEVGFALPPVYRVFIAEHSGCSFENSIFTRVLEDGYEQELAVDELFSLQEIREGWKDIERYANLLGLMQIGSTPGQPIICVGIWAENIDRVFVVDGDFGITFLSNNIQNFIDTKLDAGKHQ